MVRVMLKQDMPFQFHTMENVWIPMRDGTRLAARLWLPETGDDPVPAALEYIPYGKTDGVRCRDDAIHGFLSGHGYACVRVDMRGSGESEGLLLDEYLPQEQEDALDVIAWIADQPWCSGDVAMMGKSWGGFNALQVAAMHPPALRTVICVGFTDDRYADDVHYRGGCLMGDNFAWGNLMIAYQSRAIDPRIRPNDWLEDTRRRLENMPLWFLPWMRHQTRDAYWRHGSVCEDYGAIQVPVFACDGWADGYRNPVFRLMEHLDVPRKAIVGPWAHLFGYEGVPGPAIDFLGEMVEWLDHWLKGKNNAAMNSPMLRVWVNDAAKPMSTMLVSHGHWVGLDAWPVDRDEGVDSGVMTYVVGQFDQLLVSSGSANLRGRNNSRWEALRTPLAHGLTAGEWMGAGVLGELPPNQRLDDSMALTFDSAPLEGDLTIVGAPRLLVQLRSDQPEAQLFAQLDDVDPEGASRRICYGVLNLTHLHGHDHVVPLIPGEIVNAELDLDVCAWHLERGHRLRLALANSFWPMVWPSPRRTRLDLDLRSLRLLVPHCRVSRIVGPSTDARCAPMSSTTVIRPGKMHRTITYDLAADTWTSVVDADGGAFGEGVYRYDDFGTSSDHNLRRTMSIANNDPLSARYRMEQHVTVGRPEWNAHADVDMTLTADETRFHVVGLIDVLVNGCNELHRPVDEWIERCGL